MLTIRYGSVATLTKAPLVTSSDAKAPTDNVDDTRTLRRLNLRLLLFRAMYTHKAL